MKRDRHYTVTATTPEGDIEITGNAYGDAPFAGVVNEMVSDHAHDKGFTERDVTVTGAWWVNEP